MLPDNERLREVAKRSALWSVLWAIGMLMVATYLRRQGEAPDNLAGLAAWGPVLWLGGAVAHAAAAMFGGIAIGRALAENGHTGTRLQSFLLGAGLGTILLGYVSLRVWMGHVDKLPATGPTAFSGEMNIILGPAGVVIFMGVLALHRFIDNVAKKHPDILSSGDDDHIDEAGVI